MKSFVASQLINAVIVIIVTVVTVRYTKLGSLGVSQRTKAKLTAISLRLLRIGFPLFVVAGCGFALYTYVYGLRNEPLTRAHVFYIAFYTSATFYWFNQLLDAVLDRHPS